MEQHPDCDRIQPPSGEQDWVLEVRRSLEHDQNKTRELASPPELIAAPEDGTSTCSNNDESPNSV